MLRKQSMDHLKNKPALALKIIMYSIKVLFHSPVGFIVGVVLLSNFTMHSISLQSFGISADFLKEFEF